MISTYGLNDYDYWTYNNNMILQKQKKNLSQQRTNFDENQKPKNFRPTFRLKEKQIKRK